MNLVVIFSPNNVKRSFSLEEYLKASLPVENSIMTKYPHALKLITVICLLSCCTTSSNNQTYQDFLAMRDDHLNHILKSIREVKNIVLKRQNDINDCFGEDLNHLLSKAIVLVDLNPEIGKLSFHETNIDDWISNSDEIDLCIRKVLNRIKLNKIEFTEYDSSNFHLVIGIGSEPYHNIKMGDRFFTVPPKEACIYLVHNIFVYKGNWSDIKFYKKKLYYDKKNVESLGTENKFLCTNEQWEIKLKNSTGETHLHEDNSKEWYLFDNVSIK